jgi:3-deoxy-D-manno-octulosonic acid (KDO) 8-phosphate synthase
VWGAIGVGRWPSAKTVRNHFGRFSDGIAARGGSGTYSMRVAVSYRFTLDLLAVPVLKERTHLPVIVDPSHAAGRRDLVEPLSLAAASVGADGLIVEVHPRPDEALCDGPQQLRAADFGDYMRRVEAAALVAGKRLHVAADAESWTAVAAESHTAMTPASV